MNSKQLGDFSEKIACYYLKNKGYKILDKNYSKRWVGGPQKGEIDIVAEKGETISFIEVKSLFHKNTQADILRTNSFRPEEKVNHLKQRKIIKTAQNWLMAKKIPLDSRWQIDIIGIKINLNSKKAKITHFKNAVSE